MNNYDNSEPKVLKTLKSDGNVVDESGEVINETSDYWEQVYEQSEPKVDKILHSDGTIKDAAGNLIQDTTDFNVEKYNQAEPTPAKYLHSDGTIDENPGGGSSADLEDNKEATIDVSTYTEPVEITPTAGKDGMKKATIILSNIPSGAELVYDNTINYDTVLSSGTNITVSSYGYSNGIHNITADGVTGLGSLVEGFTSYVGTLGSTIVVSAYFPSPEEEG